MDPEFVQDLQDPDYVEAFIKEWNESRLDMFALSPPNEDLQFSGVMRFYFQDRGQKAVTKCVRVNNEQTVRNIMPVLIEKFCPDMKMLATPNYELYEIHGTGDVRKLSLDEKPLLVQLFWHKDDREGRFVLKDGNVKIQPIKFFEINQDEGQLKRRLSRREKKDLKKKRKEEYNLRSKNNDKALVDKVYNELPESSLTRTISNPEAVMRRRRQQKLEKRIKEFQNKEGPQTGGILKIFAESLKPEIPYKTILASVKDNAETVTIAALDKFLITKEHPNNFCIVMAIIPPVDSKDSVNLCKERVIRAHDCPLAIQNSWPKSKGILTFHLRRKHGVPEPPPAPKEIPTAKRSLSLSMSAKKGKLELPKTPPVQQPDARRGTSENISKDLMPYFLELTPEGKEINYKPKIYYIKPHETVIGSSRNPSSDVQYMQLFSPKILPSHCSIVNADGTVSMVPHGPDADVRILGKRIYDTSLLKTGDIVQFGGLHTFRFCNPFEDADDASSIASGGFRESLIHSSNNDLPSYNKKDTHSSISPEMMELILNEKGSMVDDDHTLETTFGVSGEVETNKTKKQMYQAKSVDNLQDTSYNSTSNLHDSFRKHRQSAPDILNSLNDIDNLLPASLSFIDNGKDAFFAAVISEVNGAALSFKLAPTYTLYLAARYVLTQNFNPGINPSEQTRLVGNIAKQIAISIQQTIQENDCLAGGLAFWMANASELLHFYRQDIDLGPRTQTAQAILAQSIQEAFALLVNAMEEQLSLALPAFLDPFECVDIHPEELDAILNDEILERAESTELLNWTSEDNHRTFRINDGPYGGTMGEQWVPPALRIKNHGAPIMADVLYILSSAMSLLRRCRVNAALTIQLFSQLFHYINMWVFNRIILEPDLRLCTRLWGSCLRVRLSYVEAWAERQGLELAADCHLARIVQTAHLLEAPKDTIEDLADLTSTCFKLNSLQIRVLLENYLTEDYEPILPQDVIDSIVSIAESTSDELTYNDGREVKLEEDIQLQLPFLLPEEGYSSDIVRGVPPGLQEFLEPLCAAGLCELILNQQSMGVWTVYQEPYKDSFDESRDSQLLDDLPVQRVTIDKGKSGLGLSICSAKGAHSDFTGIYIKAVIKGSLADKDGRIHAGDQILSVNDIGLVDVAQTQAAQIMGKSGSIITMEIIKGAAFYHGLSAIVEDEVPKDFVETVDGNANNKQNSSNVKLNTSNISDVDKEAQIKVNTNDIKPLQMNSEVQIETKKESVLYNEMNEKYHDSDFDEDGNLLTKEEKERLARQKQREREYEERIAKWEAERLQREAEENAMKVDQRVYYNDGEIDQEHEVQLENECSEVNFEEEGYDYNMTHYEHQLDVENRIVTQEQRDKEEQRRLQYEREQMRIEEEILQQEKEKERLAQDMKQKMIEKKERERIEQEREQQRLEAERKKKYEAEQEQIRVKREQDYQNELRARKERERIEKEREQRLEAEKQRQYEEEQERIRFKKEQEYQSELRAQKERERIEKEVEQQRLEAEKRRQYEEEQDKIRLKQEEEYQNELRAQKERVRLEKEREQQRLEIEIRKKYEEEQEKIRVKREQEYQNEIRAQKERERIEQEREQQWLEAERKKQYEAEQEKIRIKREQDYQNELSARKEREKIEKEREQRLEAQKQRQYEEEQERIRFKKEQEYQSELRAQKERERIEKEKEQQRVEAERRKQYVEEQEKNRVRREQEYQNELRAQKERERIAKEKQQQEEQRVKMEERNSGYQSSVEKIRKLKLHENPSKGTQESNELDKEMANIDDALREAERIAAEMDFLMFEEEQKIEEDSIKKRKEEKFDWEKSNFKRQERDQHQLVSTKSSIDFLPPPPEDLLFASPQQNRYEPSCATSDKSIDTNNIFEKMLDKQPIKKEHHDEGINLSSIRANDQFNERLEKRSPAVKPKNYKHNNPIDSQKINNINNRSGMPKFPSALSKSHDGASSDDDLAPPRPPPPRNGASPISSPSQFIQKSSNQNNGHRKVSLDKSIGMQPVTIIIKDGEPEVLNMKSKLKLFNDFQS